MADTAENQAVLRVARTTPVSPLAGAIVKNLGSGKQVRLVAIGAGAVNQMLKGVTIARGISAQNGHDIFFTSGFSDEVINEETRSALNIYVHRRSLHG